MKTIAIVAGGDSPEYEVSVKSALEVSKNLAGRYTTYIIMVRGNNWFWEDRKGRYCTIDKNDFTLDTGEFWVKFDAVFIAIHGTPGENGLLQGYFDMIGMPYTSCGAFASALTFNKHTCKLFLSEYEIPMARSVLISKHGRFDADAVIAKTGIPCFVKPNDSGSSFGVTKVNKPEDFESALEKAFAESNQVLIESYLKGREVGCGVVKTKTTSMVMPVTEIISKNEFFDYEAKYTPGRSEEVTPANLPEAVTEKIREQSSQIYDLLGCRGIVRVDFIVVDDIPYFLEINTVPGMTRESLIPKQAEAAGLALDALYSMVIEDLF